MKMSSINENIIIGAGSKPAQINFKQGVSTPCSNNEGNEIFRLQNNRMVLSWLNPIPIRAQHAVPLQNLNSHNVIL
jgi:hypothetical protein